MGSGPLSALLGLLLVVGLVLGHLLGVLQGVGLTAVGSAYRRAVYLDTAMHCGVVRDLSNVVPVVAGGERG